MLSRLHFGQRFRAACCDPGLSLDLAWRCWPLLGDAQQLARFGASARRKGMASHYDFVTYATFVFFLLTQVQFLFDRKDHFWISFSGIVRLGERRKSPFVIDFWFYFLFS